MLLAGTMVVASVKWSGSMAPVIICSLDKADVSICSGADYASSDDGDAVV